MGLSYIIVLIYSILILHNVCATELIQQKDESNLEIMEKKDAYEGVRRDTEILTTKSPTTLDAKKVRNDVEEETEELNLEIDTDEEVQHPPPLSNIGGPKTLKDDHAHIPNENEFHVEHEKEDQKPQEEHKTTDVQPNCDKPKYTGPCRASKPRFYFNIESNNCEMFIYGGCGSNGNNYITKEDCEDNCVNANSEVSFNST